MLSYTDSTTLLVFIFVFILTYLFLTRRDMRIPPGPPLVPVIGNLLSLASKDSLENLAQLRKEYGDIYGLYIGKELTVFLNGYDAIHDALIKNGTLFSRRPMTPFTIAVDVYTGVITANGKLWKEQRALTQKALQKLCFKNRSEHIETVILSETKKLMEKLEDLNTAVYPKTYLSVSTANVISRVIWNKSFDLDDPEFTGFLEKVSKSTTSMMRKLVLINCFPFLLKLPIDILDMKAVFYGVTTWHKIMEKRLLGEDSENSDNDFVDVYLQAVKENENNNLSQTFTKLQLCNTTFDLLIAGSDTTATTINWLLLYLLNHPEMETRLQLEIDDVIGRERTPSLNDRPNMPYMEATIMEGLRIAHAVPLAVPHSVNSDVIFKGHVIRKDTTVVANLHSVMMDPNLWEEPDTFRPERFLTADHKKVEIPKYFIPFSLGPRSCLGETLAKMELFLYMTSLLQRFKLKPEDAVALPPVKGNLGLTFTPQPYSLRFVKK